MPNERVCGDQGKASELYENPNEKDAFFDLLFR